MTKKNSNIQLLQWYYNFLSIGKFLESLIKQDDVSLLAKDTKVQTWTQTYFTLKGTTLQKILEQIHKNPDKTNLFGYMVEVNAIRGIMSVMKELLNQDEKFKIFVQKKLGNQYRSFEQIIILIRNVLTHNIDPNLPIHQENIDRQKAYLMEKKKTIVTLKFIYAQHRKEWKGSSDYGVQITINFQKLKQGQKLYTIIPLHQIYLLAELCYNIAQLYKK